MTNRKDKKLQTAEPLPRDVERIVDSDPDTGGVVEHLRYKRVRMIDGLYEDGWLTGDQFLAADKLRACFDAARLVPDAGAQSMVVVVAGAVVERVVPEKPREQYHRMMAWLSKDERRIIVAVVLHDEHPNSYGQRRKCNGLSMLTRCLDKLVRNLS